MQLKNDLWDFALSFYRSPEVEAVCLELQDQHGLSINRLLFTCWASLEGIDLVDADFTGEASDWQQQVTHRVRQARYRVRPDKAKVAACYGKLREAELACEQVELALLFSTVSEREASSYSIERLINNIAVYLTSAQVAMDKCLQQRLQRLEQAVSIFRLNY